MTDDEQFNSTFLIASNAGELKGCGFFVGPLHAMTCEHVVRYCLESDGPAADGTVVGHWNGHPFALRPVRNRADLPDDDVCVLEAVAGVPPGILPVRWEPCESDYPFLGKGISVSKDAEGRPALIDQQVDGKVGPLLRPTRHIVRSEGADGRILPGCSGAAVFHTRGRRNLIGMVAEYRQDKSGTIIRAQALRDCWPDLKQANAEPFEDIGPAPAAKGLVLRDLDDTLARCDREDQTDPFRDRLGPLLAHRKGVLLTTIYGGEDDLPDRLGHRLSELGPQAFVKRGRSGKPMPRPSIDMSKCVAADGPGLRAKIQYRLQDVLDSPTAEIADLATALKRHGRPLSLEVRLTDDYVATYGAMAAKQWTKVGKEIAEAGLTYPLFVFFIITKTTPDGDVERMEKWKVSDSGFLVLKELEPIAIGDIESWAKTCYGALSPTIVQTVRTRAAGAASVRLRHLQNWLTGG